jgi:hypothetical protein
LKISEGAKPFALRRTKDLNEERMYFERRDLFTGPDLVFLDTTSIYFEGEGEKDLGPKGRSKDHRPDLNQMIVGVVLDNRGKPVCCEMWPRQYDGCEVPYPGHGSYPEPFPCGAVLCRCRPGNDQCADA